ncbi:HAD-like protein [Neolentinus lepideus HHB14362 ss-1]|uniref:Mitochondrial import inner membrane translocase subunit TIM50 n=1 Tax=Neolentinus lepideus HHB14362 ss-1 TaxID=1314782 RepID=A0A165PJB5_9AGAM|nr:HAD-like protein [Neolentinus lepideus HHB14362 ss-1]
MASKSKRTSKSPEQSSSTLPPPPTNPPAPNPPTATPPSNLRSLDFETTATDLPTSLTKSAESEAPEGQGEDGGQPKERTGARSSKDSLSSIERKRRVLGRVSLVILLLATIAEGVYMGREWEAEELKEKKMTPETAPSSRWGRTKARFWDFFGVFSEPQWPELLPPPLPPPHQKPYTLLISLQDLLVWSTWDRQHGWRTAKRPGVDYFLAYLSQFFEIVIFTTDPSYTAAPVVEKLDPYNMFVTYKLFREATRMVDGAAVKDLSYLNRPLEKVIILDAHAEHVKTHPDNAVILKPWKGERGDKGLIAMIPFLESIGIYKPPDVRPILTAYAGKDIPIEYARKEAEMKAKHIVEWKEKHKHGTGLGGFTLSSLFGASSVNTSPIPPTYLEQKRAEAQQMYKEEQAYIAAHKDEFERLLEEDRKAMAREMSGSLWGAIGKMAVPPDQQQAQGQAEVHAQAQAQGQLVPVQDKS